MLKKSLETLLCRVPILHSVEKFVCKLTGSYRLKGALIERGVINYS